MQNFARIDTTTLKQLIVIAIPMVISQGAFAVMIFTDRYFMSLISPTHMAASLGGGVASFFCLSLFIGVLSYANALVAQYYGAGQWQKCTRVVTQSLLLCVVSAPLLLVVGYYTGNIFAAMGHDPVQEALEKSYFNILIGGSFITLCKTSIASYFSGIGRTKVVMISDTLGVALNIPLSYALIFGVFGFPEMGIVGAAVGTIISTAFSVCLFALFYFERSHRMQFKVATSWVIDTAIIRRYMRLGFPSGMEMFLNVAAFNLFLLMFQSYGVEAGASAAIVFNWDILSFVPMMGLNIAIISLIGRSVGAGSSDNMDGIIACSFLLALGYSGTLALLFVIFRTPLVELFITSGVNFDGIRELSSYMMVGLATYTMADATILVVGGVLRGAGDTRWLMKASVSLHWAMLVAQYIVIKILDFGPKASWVIFVSMIISIALVYLLRLHGQKWRNPDVLRQVLAEH